MEEYGKIKKYMSLFDKECYLNLFTNADFFMNIFGKKKYLFSFLSDIYENSNGIQIFNNDNGFNYIHDVLSIKDDNMIVAGRLDSVIAVYVDKDFLNKDEIDYIHKMGFKLKKEKNLLIFRYEIGMAKRFANKKEMNDLIKNCEFIKSLLEDNFTDIVSAFETERMPISIIDEIKYEYHTMYLPLPNLQVMPRKLPINNQVYEDFKNIQFTGDECYMFVAYTPLIIKETGVRPLLIYFYFQEKNKVIFKYITDNYKEYKNYIFGILDEVLNKEGLPEKLYLNDRKFYSFLYKTMESLNVEVELLLEDNVVDDNLLDAVERLYQNSEELYVESKDGIEMVLDLVVSELNSLSEILEENGNFKDKEKIVV